MPRFACASSIVLLAVSCLSVPAQLTTSKVTFRNQGEYTQTDLEQVAGLHAGEKTSRAAIQAAAQRLMDTGYFDDIKQDSKGTPGALEIIFTLKPEPPAKGSAVGFDNFVWLTPSELQAVVHQAAPLFHGRLPEGGNAVNTIQQALQTALRGRGITGEVSSETVEPSTQQPQRVTEYRVDPPVRIHKVSLTGVPPELAAAEDKVTAELPFTAYNEGLTGDTTPSALLAPARNAGHLEAQLTGLQRTVTGGRQVDVSATLEPGAVYRVSKITFSPELSGEAAAAAASPRLRPGDIASGRELLLTAKPIEDAYRKQGYMDVYVDPGETLDTATHTVSYNLTVVPGNVYHLHTVTPVGLSPAALADFNKAWTLKPGDIYNADYVSHLIENNSALRALATYKATFRTEFDPATHLVDLTIRFEPNSISTRR